MKPIDVMIVDDQRLFVESLKKLLEYDSPEIQVSSLAYSGEEAIENIGVHKPDVILMDIRMKDMDGVEATRKILGIYPEMKVLILTMFEDDEHVHKALKAGARGYLLKDIPSEELTAGIKAVASGSVLISPQIVQKLVSHEHLRSDDLHIEDFSKREVDVLRLILQGRDNQQIADELFLSEQTIRNYISGIYSKCHVKKRAHLIRKINESDIELKSQLSKII
jgi:DNA-binding NarL/FixJ family response regulator